MPIIAVIFVFIFILDNRNPLQTGEHVRLGSLTRTSAAVAR